MKKSLVVLCAAVALAFVSCDVQERIVFNEHMGGSYETSFDLSQMLESVGSMGASSKDEPSKKLDTLITFNDILVKYKDSIATLPKEKQVQLQNMKNMTMRMQMDEGNNIFKFNIGKEFARFSEIEFVSYEMDEMIDLAKNNAAQEAGPAGDMLKTEKVRYFFENNTFKRVDEKLVNSEEVELEVVEESEEDMMMQGMMAEFDDMLLESKMKLEYVFPRKVKSVSMEGTK
ncbi:MAG: hypothetical protein ACI917_001221, partial [Patiriisocius sp.]